MRIAEIHLGARPNLMSVLATQDFELVLHGHFETAALIGN
jgi:hypothetical protein